MPGTLPKPASPPPPDAGQASLAQAIVDAVPAHIAVLDRRGVILAVNSAWRRFALENASTPGVMPPGCEVGANYLAVCEAARGLASEGAVEAAAGMRAVLAGERAEFRLEYPCHSPETRRWFLMWVTPLPRPEPDVVVVHVDITARMLAEMAARVSGMRLELALEASGDGLWDWDIQANQAYLSPGYFALTGYSPGEVSPDLAFFRRLVHPDDWPRVSAKMEAHLRGETPFSEIEYRMVTAGGEQCWIRGRGQVVERDQSGRPLRMVGLISDIGEQKRLERALRDSEARYRAVVEDQTEVISRFLIDGTITYINEVFCRFFGKTAEELLGRRWQPVAHPDDLPMIEAKLAQMSPARPVVTIENRVYTGDGSLRWMEFVNRALYDDAGRIREIQSVGRDITPRKEIEARKDALAEEIARLSRELINVRERERGALARELHDELSQDLTAIRAHAAAILRARNPTLTAMRADAQAIETSAGRIYAVSHRIMEGLRPQALDSIRLSDALESLVREWSAQQPVIRATFRCAARQLAVDAETRIHMYRIAQECLANLTKHARARRVRLFLGYRRRGDRDWLRLVVRDDGVGMHCPGQGPGLGLIGMRERAHALGGSFDCVSRLGHGVRIAVELPLGA